jgi:hypothetical protein
MQSGILKLLGMGMAFAGLAFMVSCASGPQMRRVFVDSTTHHDDIPDWAKSDKTSWEKDGKIFVMAASNARGTDRVDGCYDLARLNAKEQILSEIANDIRGRLDNAQQSISENAEVVLGKVRSGEFEGRLTGLRFTNSYYERYMLGDMQKLSCYVLSEIRQSDYDSVKRAVVDKVVAVDPKIKEAILSKQVEFFKGPAPASTPASGNGASAAAPVTTTSATATP